MQQKQLSLQQYKLTSGNKKNLKQPNLTHKGARKRRINKTQSQQKERNNKDQIRNKNKENNSKGQ